MKLTNVTMGMRVIARAAADEDTESGIVMDINPMSATGHEVLVGWDQGTSNWVEASQLEEANG